LQEIRQQPAPAHSPDGGEPQHPQDQGRREDARSREDRQAGRAGEAVQLVGQADRCTEEIARDEVCRGAGASSRPAALMETVQETHAVTANARPAEADNGAAGIPVPRRPLQVRARAWLLWLTVAALLVWSWGPTEMHKITSLVTDWRNMAEFG